MSTTPRSSNLKSRTEILRRLVVVVLAVAVTIPVIVKSRPNRVSPVGTAFLVSTSSTGYLSVSGEVRHPGIYPLTANMLTTDAIRLAVPLIELKGIAPYGVEAMPIKNGSEIRLLMRQDGSAEIVSGFLTCARRMLLGIPLDINAMSAEDFDRLPGIGPVMAKRIVEYRQFHGGHMKVEELKMIEGIGEKKYLHLKKYF